MSRGKVRKSIIRALTQRSRHKCGRGTRTPDHSRALARLSLESAILTIAQQVLYLGLLEVYDDR